MQDDEINPKKKHSNVISIYCCQNGCGIPKENNIMKEFCDILLSHDIQATSQNNTSLLTYFPSAFDALMSAGNNFWMTRSGFSQSICLMRKIDF